MKKKKPMGARSVRFDMAHLKKARANNLDVSAICRRALTEAVQWAELNKKEGKAK